MKCLADEIISQYVDNGFPGKETGKIIAHLSGCQRCQAREKDIRAGINYITEKMEALEPQEIPQIDFIPSGKTGFSFLRNYIRDFKSLFTLKPVSAAVSLVLSSIIILILLFSILSQKGNNKVRPTIIRSVSIGGEAAQAYIFDDNDKKVTIVWIEKK